VATPAYQRESYTLRPAFSLFNCCKTIVKLLTAFLHFVVTITLILSEYSLQRFPIIYPNYALYIFIYFYIYL